MKFSLFFIASSILFSTLFRGVTAGIADLCGLLAPKEQCEDTFSAVTSFDGVKELYKDFRSKELHFKPNLSVNDTNLKKRICESVASSGYMEMKKENPSNMCANYLDMVFAARKHERSYSSTSLHREVLEDYEMKTLGYNYRSRIVQFDGQREFAFACATKQSDDYKEIMVYYISDPYTLDLNPEEQVSIRFICHRDCSSRCMVVAIAEVPAVVFSVPTIPLEEIYVQMRKYFNREESASEDPVCGLTRQQKVRICASVMNTPPFVGRIKYLPKDSIIENCKLRNVAFQTEEANLAASGEVFQEWMLECLVKPIDEFAAYAYWVSRAYHSNHVFVYAYNPTLKNWVIENISGRVAVVTDVPSAVREECVDCDRPNLVVFLKNPEKAKDGKLSQKQKN